MKKKTLIRGEYNHDGYKVFADSKEILRCGRSSLLKYLTPIRRSKSGSLYNLSLRQIREFCKKACQEIAADLGADCAGVERVDEKEL